MSVNPPINSINRENWADAFTWEEIHSIVRDAQVPNEAIDYDGLNLLEHHDSPGAKTEMVDRITSYLFATVHNSDPRDTIPWGAYPLEVRDFVCRAAYYKAIGVQGITDPTKREELLNWPRDENPWPNN